MRNVITAATAVISAFLASEPARAADPYAGASVDGTASHYALVCGTCPVDSVTDYTAKLGGPGTFGVSFFDEGVGWSLGASASLGGPDALPVLGGLASAEVRVDPTVPKTYFYKDAAFATATQRYDYTGTIPATYTIDTLLTASGTLTSNDAASLMQAYGGFTVYGSNFNPVGENRGTVLDTLFQSARPSVVGTTNFSLPGQLNFTVNPGDAFYVSGALSVTADASHQVDGGIDASHTLTAHFSQGDVSLLRPALVPIPAPAVLLASGLGVLAGLRRSRAATLVPQKVGG